MINVLQVVGGLDRGGIETLFYNIYKNLDKKEFQFIFLCYGNEHFDYEDSLKEMGAKIVRMDYPSLAIWKYCSELKKVLKREKIDVVHCNTYFNSGIVNFVAKRAGVKVRITHSHSSIDDKKQTLSRKIYAWICRRMIFAYTTHFAACSREAAVALFGERKYKTIVNGVETSNFRYRKEWRDEVRKMFEIRKDAILIGTVGRQTDVKNPLFLIDIFKEFYVSNRNSYLIMVGGGERRSDIQKRVKEFGLENNVVLVDPTSDVNKIYSAMDYFVLPSILEGLPTVAIEAQVSGLPIFISSGITDEVKITSLVQKIRLTEGSKCWAKKISDTKLNVLRDKVNIDDRYDIVNVTKDLEAWYEEIL